MKAVQSRPLEAEGLTLVDAYDRARRAYAEFTPPPSPVFVLYVDVNGMVVNDLLCPAACDWWVWHRHLLGLDLVDARDDLQLHVATFGPVETEAGIFKLDGDGRLAYRRHYHDLLYRGAPCNN